MDQGKEEAMVTPGRASIRMDIASRASAPSRLDNKFPLLSTYNSNKQRDGPLLAPIPLKVLRGPILSGVLRPKVSTTMPRDLPPRLIITSLGAGRRPP